MDIPVDDELGLPALACVLTMRFTPGFIIPKFSCSTNAAERQSGAVQLPLLTAGTYHYAVSDTVTGADPSRRQIFKPGDTLTIERVHRDCALKLLKRLAQGRTASAGLRMTGSGSVTLSLFSTNGLAGHQLATGRKLARII